MGGVHRGRRPHHDYLGAIEAAGLEVEYVRANEVPFLSPRARTAADKYGVTSVTVLATNRSTPVDAVSRRTVVALLATFCSPTPPADPAAAAPGQLA